MSTYGSDRAVSSVWGRFARDVEGRVVRSGGEYYRVHTVSRSEPTWDRNSLLVLAVRGFPLVVGLGVLYRRWSPS